MTKKLQKKNNKKKKSKKKKKKKIVKFFSDETFYVHGHLQSVKKHYKTDIEKYGGTIYEKNDIIYDHIYPSYVVIGHKAIDDRTVDTKFWEMIREHSLIPRVVNEDYVLDCIDEQRIISETEYHVDWESVDEGDTDDSDDAMVMFYI